MQAQRLNTGMAVRFVGHPDHVAPPSLDSTKGIIEGGEGDDLYWVRLQTGTLVKLHAMQVERKDG
jgi:hypothetical protein